VLNFAPAASFPHPIVHHFTEQQAKKELLDTNEARTLQREQGERTYHDHTYVINITRDNFWNLFAARPDPGNPSQPYLPPLLAVFERLLVCTPSTVLLFGFPCVDFLFVFLPPSLISFVNRIESFRQASRHCSYIFQASLKASAAVPKLQELELISLVPVFTLFFLLRFSVVSKLNLPKLFVLSFELQLLQHRKGRARTLKP
jgi:hypothetical protein